MKPAFLIAAALLGCSVASAASAAPASDKGNTWYWMNNDETPCTRWKGAVPPDQFTREFKGISILAMERVPLPDGSTSINIRVRDDAGRLIYAKYVSSYDACMEIATATKARGGW